MLVLDSTMLCSIKALDDIERFFVLDYNCEFIKLHTELIAAH